MYFSGKKIDHNKKNYSIILSVLMSWKLPNVDIKYKFSFVVVVGFKAKIT